MTSLDGLVALITGGNGGIGLGMGRALAAAGADLVIWGRNGDKNAAAVDELRRLGGRVEAFACDVTDEDQVIESFARSTAAMGKVDIVFANAGVNGPKKIVDMPFDEWRHVLSTNVDGVFLTVREGARHLVERGEGGSIVIISSTSAVHGAGGNAAYGTSKTAVLGLMRALAVEMARHQVRVNALTPGWTVTDLATLPYDNPDFREITTRRTPVRRWADPDEMGAAAVYLADPSHTFHTGDTVTVDGGYTIF